MLATELVVLAFSIYQFFVVAILYTLSVALLYVFLAIYRPNSGEKGLAYISFRHRVHSRYCYCYLCGLA
jgi:hypothetical protein